MKNVKKDRYGSSHQEVFCKSGFVRNFSEFTGKHLPQSLFFNKEKKTLAQVFSHEFWEITKNIISYRIPMVAASVVILETC